METPEQRAEEIGCRAHKLCLLIGNGQILQLARVYFNGVFVYHTDFRAHFGHNLKGNRNVAYSGYIFNNARLVRENSCGKNSNHSVFSAVYGNLAREPFSALYNKFFHKEFPSALKIGHCFVLGTYKNRFEPV